MQLVNSTRGNMINDFGDSGRAPIEARNWRHDDGTHFRHDYHISQVAEMKGRLPRNKD
jgi:hypothetical protein